VVARFHKVLLTTVFERFQALNKLVAAHAAPAVEGGGVGSGEFGFGFDLKLEPLDI
jgi:hypothetical protein